MKKLNYDRITTTIEREWLAQIIAATSRSRGGKWHEFASCCKLEVYTLGSPVAQW
jgi:hypothetical protein